MAHLFFLSLFSHPYNVFSGFFFFFFFHRCLPSRIELHNLFSQHNALSSKIQGQSMLFTSNFLPLSASATNNNHTGVPVFPNPISACLHFLHLIHSFIRSPGFSPVSSQPFYFGLRTISALLSSHTGRRRRHLWAKQVRRDLFCGSVERYNPQLVLPLDLVGPLAFVLLLVDYEAEVLP